MSTTFKVLMNPVRDELVEGGISFSFSKEFASYTEALEFISEEKLEDFRIIKTSWEDITDLYHSRK